MHSPTALTLVLLLLVLFACDGVRKQVVGGKGVGKTSIIRRYTQDLFSKTYVPTIGTLRHLPVRSFNSNRWP
jgi:hypothetical protein